MYRPIGCLYSTFYNIKGTFSDLVYENQCLFFSNVIRESGQDRQDLDGSGERNVRL